MCKASSLTLMLLACICLAAAAEVPQVINYQGRLTDAEGQAVPDGQYEVKFKIWSSPTYNLQIFQLWSSGPHVVEVKNGLFDYQLGSDDPFPDNLFTDWSAIYLGVSIDGHPEIMPRTQLVAVPYAIQSVRSDTAGHAVSVADGGVGPGAIVNDAVSSTQIIGEPGIARAVTMGDVALSSTNMVDIVVVTITTPSDGFILLMAETMLHLWGTTTQQKAILQIDTAAGGEIADHGVWVGLGGYSQSYHGNYFPCSLSRLFVKPAGTYTFRFEGVPMNLVGECSVSRSKLTAMFFPTAYGSTEAVASQNGHTEIQSR